MNVERRSIFHHAIIGGWIAIVLAMSEMKAPEWFREATESRPNWYKAVKLSVVFIGAFGGIVFFDWVCEWKARRDARKPRVMAGIGRPIDGDWVDAVWAEGEKEPEVACFIRIRSTGRGYEIAGVAYRVKDLLGAEYSTARQVGDFIAHGATWGEGQRGLHYYYDGREDGRGSDAGVGFYHFSTIPGNDVDMTYHGSFVSSDAKVHHVRGRLLTKKDSSGGFGDDGRAMVRRFLESRPAR